MLRIERDQIGLEVTKRGTKVRGKRRLPTAKVSFSNVRVPFLADIRGLRSAIWGCSPLPLGDSQFYIVPK